MTYCDAGSQITAVILCPTSLTKVESAETVDVFMKIHLPSVTEALTSFQKQNERTTNGNSIPRGVFQGKAPSPVHESSLVPCIKLTWTRA